MIPKRKGKKRKHSGELPETRLQPCRPPGPTHLSTWTGQGPCLLSPWNQMDENTLTSPTGDSPIRSSISIFSCFSGSFFYITWPFALGFFFFFLFPTLCYTGHVTILTTSTHLLFCLPQLLFITSTAIAIDPAYCR